MVRLVYSTLYDQVMCKTFYHEKGEWDKMADICEIQFLSCWKNLCSQLSPLEVQKILHTAPEKFGPIYEGKHIGDPDNADPCIS